jgi:SAM-dependent methyltransferase
VLAARADRYGLEPSAPARWAAGLFQEQGVVDVLELGAGQGRDSLYVARLGMHVQALDFADSGAEATRAKAGDAELAGSLQATVHDCCEPLPFPDASFDACYSHMLFSMALTTPQLGQLSAEVRRVLRPGGLHVYTARTTADPDYGTGLAHGDDMYESDGFVVHFFSRELVQRLARGFTLLEVDEFEEGDLPRRLFRVVERRSATEPVVETDYSACAEDANEVCWTRPERPRAGFVRRLRGGDTS